MAVPVTIIDGDVIAIYSHWTSDGSRIVTEATIHAGDGQDYVVSQLGGTVDGVGMVQMPGPEILAPGMHVAAAVHGDVDLAQREHIVLDSVKVLDYPAGFVRTGPTLGGNPLHWESGCIFVTIDAAGTSAIPGDGEFPVIDASIQTWNTATTNASCSFMTVMSDGRKAMEVGNDHVNVIKIRDDMWGRPKIGDDPARMYSPQAAGITTATYIDECKDKDGSCKASCMDTSGRCHTTSSRDGTILDADVEINNVNFDVVVNNGGRPNGPRGLCAAELQNTLTHELGHLHGLEHPCLAPGDPPRIDGQGNPVPSCGDVQSAPTLPQNRAILESTMYNYQNCGEVTKETLSDDDINAMCTIYPAGESHTCERVGETSSGGGCCSASGRDRADSTLFVAGLTFLLLRRRRRGAARTAAQAS